MEPFLAVHALHDQRRDDPVRGRVRDATKNVPQAIRHAILIETANLYENREDAVVGQAVNMLAVSERLLWPYRALGAD